MSDTHDDCNRDGEKQLLFSGDSFLAFMKDDAEIWPVLMPLVEGADNLSLLHTPDFYGVGFVSDGHMQVAVSFPLLAGIIAKSEHVRRMVEGLKSCSLDPTYDEDGTSVEHDDHWLLTLDSGNTDE